MMKFSLLMCLMIFLWACPRDQQNKQTTELLRQQGASLGIEGQQVPSGEAVAGKINESLNPPQNPPCSGDCLVDEPGEIKLVSTPKVEVLPKEEEEDDHDIIEEDEPEESSGVRQAPAPEVATAPPPKVLNPKLAGFVKFATDQLFYDYNFIKVGKKKRTHLDHRSGWPSYKKDKKGKPKMTSGMRRKGTGHCWMFVKWALMRSGLVKTKPPSGSAKNGGGDLIRAGFKKLPHLSFAKAPVGSVFIFKGGPHGHAEVKIDSKNLASDLVRQVKPDGSVNFKVRGVKRELIGIYYKAE